MKHQKAAIKVVKNLKAYPKMVLLLAAGHGTRLKEYVDANWCGEPGRRRRYKTEIALHYGNSPVYFKTAIQNFVALGSKET